MLIELTKDRAEYFVKELNVWSVNAKIVESTENWATIEIDDDSYDPETIIVYAFNMGVSFAKNLNQTL